MQSRPISSLPRREQIVFRHFWNLLSLTSAVAQWALWRWTFDDATAELPAWVHAAFIATCAGLYRASAHVLEWSSEPRPLVNATAQAVLATGFVAVVTTSALAVIGAIWWLGGQAFLALPAAAAAGNGATLGGLGGLGFRPVGLALVGASLGLHAYGYTLGVRRLSVTEHEVAVPGLPAAFDGYRILHVSDIHLGPLALRSTLRAAFATARRLRPDLVCVTGDVVDTPNTDLDHWIPELCALDAADGVFTILGNHDRHSGARRIASALTHDTHWRVLRNAIGVIERDGARLHIIGVEDARHAQASAMLHELWHRVPEDESAVVLIHHPCAWDAATAVGAPITLAGHTHGGQLALPFARRVNVARLLGIRHDYGLFRSGQCQLHVSRGIGTSGQRVRIGAPRELTIIRLRSTPALTPSGAAVT